MDADYLKELADLVLRLLHVVAGIAWIGASFYFIRLDLGLRPPEDAADTERGVAGEYWGVHGGGFYHSQKYNVAPQALPEHLHWFKWEAYTTWLSGFALLVVLYWLDADTRLVDPGVADLSTWQAVATLGRRARARVARVRRRLPRPPGRPSSGGRSRRARHALGVRRRRALRGARGVPPGGRDARDDHGGERLLRDHPGALGARPRQAAGPRARPGAGPAREATVGAQQLPDAAGRLHDARRALPAGLRERPRLARPARDLRARRRDPALLQPLARGQAPLVDPGGGHGRSGRAGARARAGGRRDDDGRADRRASREHRRGALCRVPFGRLGTTGRAPRERRVDQEACEGARAAGRAPGRCRPATPRG